MALADLPRVVEIDRASFTLPWPEHSYRFELRENPASHCWVAETGGVIVGLMVIWLIEDEAHIATIAIHPDFRGRGIGRDLLVAGLRDAVGHGAVAATLEVRERNEAAIHLYRRFGFEVVGRRKRYYHDTNEDALIMTLERADQRLAGSPEYLNPSPGGTHDP
jgi:ribosomal-protein-alanine N-acetyltransferase